ncbi:hypothetical protein ACT6P6_10685 [Priestia endophytica]|uniref:hypothetical protein n=1 Tax=Priestia filamentosa TaxID=1402861 RepID=UPI002E20D4E8|nr:hypothetical protein [Priestia filamentosa]
MARISNFPEHFIREHETWHHEHMNMGNLRAGDGIEFLSFHREFMERCLEWYNSQGLNSDWVEPWRAVPNQIKRHPGWTRELEEAENRIRNNPSSFRSGDELGRFLQETSLHDAVHVLGSEVFDEPDFGRISLSPRSTLFYNWHRLIDNWWRSVERG